MFERDFGPHQSGAGGKADPAAILREIIEEGFDQPEAMLMVTLPAGRNIGAQRAGETRHPDDVGFGRSQPRLVTTMRVSAEARFAEPTVDEGAFAASRHE